MPLAKVKRYLQYIRAEDRAERQMRVSLALLARASFGGGEEEGKQVQGLIDLLLPEQQELALGMEEDQTLATLAQAGVFPVRKGGKPYVPGLAESEDPGAAKD